ncbi:hypothetical protein B9Z55_021040 [Caenorhabditis nigoni]|uniref:Serpentine receptor class gamma n=1 Tax=Caenorhabditis nigoni TaxID=1611254 RepID=A0A2G5TQ92_9PELO|nr:hypothetical protein B9Z55_021040 [Caenorhabditis nigoni]
MFLYLSLGPKREMASKVTVGGSSIRGNLGFLIWALRRPDNVELSNYHFYSIYYIFLNILIYTSAILHIPIVLKIRTNSHLPSVIRNQPQNYVLYQTVFMACFKTTSFYAITNHFYRAICFFYLYFGISLFIILPLVLILSGQTFLSIISHPFSVTILGIPITIFVQVHHFLIFFLSVQKLFLVFFPNSESYFEKFSGKSMIKIIYSIFILANAGFFIWAAERPKNVQFSSYSFYAIYYFFLNILIYASAFLHIPIVYKIKTNSHLPSVIRNQPQNYVLYQTVFMACFKTPQIYAIAYIHWHQVSLDLYILVCLIFDIISTPLLIQISYLCCNRRNVESLKANLSFGRKIKSIFTTNNSKISPMTIEN